MAHFSREIRNNKIKKLFYVNILVKVKQKEEKKIKNRKYRNETELMTNKSG